MAEQKAKITRRIKREMFNTVCAKSKVETIEDVWEVFYGLSRKAVEYAAYRRIMELASLGCSPQEIVTRMEAKGRKRK